MEFEVIFDQRFFCSECRNFVGTYEDLIEKSAATLHQCLQDANALDLDFSTSLIYGRKSAQVDDSASGSGVSRDAHPASSVTSALYASNTSSGASTLCNGTTASFTSSDDLLSTASSLSAVSAATSTASSKDIWSDAETKLLIAIYSEEYHKLDSPQYSVASVFKIISAKMKEQGVIKSPEKCDIKWRNLKKAYEKVVIKNNKTGNSRTKFAFFQEMHELLFKDPKVNPVCTVSSVQIKTRKIIQDTGEDSEDDLRSPQRKKEKKLTREEIEERRQRRHDEKLAQRREMFEWFKNNVKKE